MSDLISRQAALEILDDYAEDIESGNWGTAYSKARKSMCDLPSVEPEQKTGKWIDYPFENVCGQKLCDYRCNLCACFVNTKTKYCPNCGAKMEVNYANN